MQQEIISIIWDFRYGDQHYFKKQWGGVISSVKRYWRFRKRHLNDSDEFYKFTNRHYLRCNCWRKMFGMIMVSNGIYPGIA
jgi:hypothetical protein